ncbi:MAG: hypothetical protein DRP63_00925 [Planctomycetota bacterium]|nr:MAG: hypothetical protein DRP63_00925 [Planctomycetota bacterium]
MAEETPQEKPKVEIDLKQTLRKFSLEEALIAGCAFLLLVALLLPWRKGVLFNPPTSTAKIQFSASGFSSWLGIATFVMLVVLVGALVGRLTGYLGRQLVWLVYAGCGVMVFLLSVSAIATGVGTTWGCGALLSLIAGLVIAAVGVVRLVGLKHPLVERLDERLLKSAEAQSQHDEETDGKSGDEERKQ